MKKIASLNDIKPVNKDLLKTLIGTNEIEMIGLQTELQSIHDTCRNHIEFCLKNFVLQKEYKWLGILYELKEIQIQQFNIIPTKYELNPCEDEIVTLLVYEEQTEEEAKGLQKLKVSGQVVHLMTGVQDLDIVEMRNENRDFKFKQCEYSYSEINKTIGFNLINKYIEQLIKVSICEKNKTQLTQQLASSMEAKE